MLASFRLAVRLIMVLFVIDNVDKGKYGAIKYYTELLLDGIVI